MIRLNFEVSVSQQDGETLVLLLILIILVTLVILVLSSPSAV